MLLTGSQKKTDLAQNWLGAVAALRNVWLGESEEDRNAAGTVQRALARRDTLNVEMIWLHQWTSLVKWGCSDVDTSWNFS